MYGERELLSVMENYGYTIRRSQWRVLFAALSPSDSRGFCRSGGSLANEMERISNVAANSRRVL